MIVDKNGTEIKSNAALMKKVFGDKEIEAVLFIVTGPFGFHEYTFRPLKVTENIGNGCGCGVRCTSPDDIKEWELVTKPNQSLASNQITVK